MMWRVILEEDPEMLEWAAWCPELKGCVSAGETREEAIELYLEPPPGTADTPVGV